MRKSFKKLNFLLSLSFKFMILHFTLELFKKSIIQQVNCTAFDHCYSDIGCFPLKGEFYHPKHRPFNVRPWHRRRIKIYFELYSRTHPDGFVLRAWDKFNIKASQFNPLLETKIIVPGWLDNIKRALWVKRMKDAFLWLWHPVNIIVVHWKNFTPYTIATANSRVVGAELANLLLSLEQLLKYDRSFYHLIGHSLGAHISGYCGDRMPGLGRITALDPARPFFQHMPKSVRLDRGDAKFVDAIHSDFTPENAIFLIMSFGMTTPVGHVDFYPNGPPLLQPGCLRDSILSIRNGIQRGMDHNSLAVAFLESVRYLTACDHQRSHEWFTESITNRQCVFIGVRCSEFSGLINGQCSCDNSKSACAIMGIHADQLYLNGLHEDIWPASNGQTIRFNISDGPTPAPFMSTSRPDMLNILNDLNHLYYNQQLGEQLERPSIVLKEQVYASMKHNANNLRYSHGPLFSAASALIDDIVSTSGFEKVIEDDEVLMSYLRSSFFKNEPDLNYFSKQIPKTSELISSFDVQTSTKQILDQHPKLMSDIDRDIENWYENNSRWYLKTNNRASYCANQYQVLVYIGPLKTSNGRKRVRANLILSIVGSKGQLLNQRFVPRSKTLDSFTMQPFFILLQGSYSLGKILWVAIGWEARYDLDPIQATISFQSNLLQDMQSLVPYTYQAKHPWLSETLKYDHSASFRWSKPENNLIAHHGNNNELLSHVGVHLERRSSIQHDKPFTTTSSSIDDCSLEDQHTNNHCTKSLEEPILDSNLIDFNTIINKQLDELLSGNSSHILYDKGAYYEISETGKKQSTLNKSSQQQLMRPRRPDNKNQSAKQKHKKQLTSHMKPKENVNLRNNELMKQSLQKKKNKVEPQHQRRLDVTAELHNIGIHLDREPEDTIIISKVVINPLQAHYGRNMAKVGRTFCPPNQNYRLRRDQTVRLEANLLERCSGTYFNHPKQHAQSFSNFLETN